MCGIVCYLGPRDAVPILVEGLRRLEYRGYDSAGVAVVNGSGVLHERALGKIVELERRLKGVGPRVGAGIAHTRWATHGRPSEANAHPHTEESGRIFVVHNGIIENHARLRAELEAAGCVFRSETDSEVLAHLIASYRDADLEDAVARALGRVEGAFGIGVVSADDPGRVVVARRGSPLILGIGEDETFAASDVAALVSHTKDVVYLHDDDIAVLEPGEFRIRTLGGTQLSRSRHTVDWDVDAAEKGGFQHFMLKEIHEQPEAVENALRGRLIEDEGLARIGGLHAVMDRLVSTDHVIIVSCGTSYYAGLLGRYVLETCTDIGVEVDLASEFRYRKLNLRPSTVVLAISQSGETADTLAAVREAKRKGVTVLGMVNVVGSNIARETDAGMYNRAGPEVGVASTKCFMSQVTALYLMTLLLARRQAMSVNEGQRFIRELRAIPDKIRRVLDLSDHIHDIAKRYAGYRNFMFVGRKFNYPIALEGALKLKEISYLHAEAYAAGEMKHGPIALIDPSFPSICLAPRDGTYEKMLSNIEEIRARSGPVVAIGTEGDDRLAGLADDVILVPETDELMSPLVNVVPLQLLAYYVALENGCEIDQPRNLAKSVTVE